MTNVASAETPKTNVPLISIVIANYNYGRYLSRAIESVRAQTYANWELIVVDGGSEDGSVEVIKRYNQDIHWWCSEKDRGQSDAFNKGFAHATGEYITWLNADDLLLPWALMSVVNKARKTDADWLTGNFIRFDMHSHKITEAKWGPHALPVCMQGNGWPIAVYGPTTFWRKAVYERIGGIREEFHYSMDTEYWTRMYMNGVKQVRVNATCWAFGMHECSKTAEFGSHACDPKVKRRQEEEAVLRCLQNGYSPSRIKIWITWLWRLFDLSALVAIYRRLFVVGRRLESYIGSRG